MRQPTGNIIGAPVCFSDCSADGDDVENSFPEKINRNWAAIIKSSPSHFRPIVQRDKSNDISDAANDSFSGRSTNRHGTSMHQDLFVSDSSSEVPEMWFRTGSKDGSGNRFNDNDVIFSGGRNSDNDIFSGPEVSHILRKRRRSSRLRNKEVILLILMVT